MSTSSLTTWNYPCPVVFGQGARAQIVARLSAVGVERPLLVTDPGLAQHAAFLAVVERIQASMPQAEVFSKVDPNPVGRNVEQGVAAARAMDADGVLAFGGGSALDVGKAIALMVGQDRPLWDFEDVGDNYQRVHEDGMLPVVAVPTAAGTGSEVGRSSVITSEELGKKLIIFHPRMMPVATVCDPELTVSLPAHLTAATGMDALSHNLEAFCARGHHPMSDGIAIEGIRLVHRSLARAVAHGDDIEARADMLAASLMGATAFQKGLGAMHALSHPIGARLGQHHGLINAVMMPYVLCFNQNAIADRIEALARYLAIDGGFRGFVDWVLDLRRKIGIPHDATALTMNASHVDELSELAASDPAGAGNPIAMNQENYALLYRAALSGEMPAASPV